MDSARQADELAWRFQRLYGARTDVSTDSARAEARGLLGLPVKYADIAFEGLAAVELRTERFRNERCTPILLLDPNSGCDGTWKAPRIETEFNLRAAGLIGRRIHLNVDYATEREFTANNNIQVYYEGLDDEIIRRVEVGTVTFRPPPSRFLTAAIPTNNFGVNATFEVGPVQLQTLYASQSGSVANERVYTIGQVTSTPQARQVRDLDFESGRFFWTVDPTALPGYPALDILAPPVGSVPASVRPAQVQVYRYRPAASQGGTTPGVGGILALGLASDGVQRVGPLRWELLLQGSDYYLDPSGLWFALATKLDQGDYLAVSYRTADGGLVGTFPVTDDPATTDTLLLVVEPQRGPEAATFRHEMRQVYRVAGTDLNRPSLTVALTVNRSAQPLSGQGTYLALLGLATSTNPDEFDRENRLFPRLRDPGAVEILPEAYVVFPHVTPFADPGRLLPQERNDSLYRTPLYLVQTTQSPPARFMVGLEYLAAGAGDRTTLSLNALQLVEGSEQLFVGGRRLERGVDYSIAYELGQVTFLAPDALFGQGAATVTARFEERGAFTVAPKTIYGLAGRYTLGRAGWVDLVGMYQSEQTVFNRPTLGFEPTSNLVAGMSTRLSFQPRVVTQFLNRLTSTPATAPSRLEVNGEVAFSRPDPNRIGVAYLDDFEADAGFQVTLRETLWGLGSVPQSVAGLEDIGFSGVPDSADAVQLTWQNLVPGPGGGPVELRAQDIDDRIELSSVGERQETVLYLRFHADTAGGLVQRDNSSNWSQPARPFRPRWRSLATPLSSTGIDLSRNEILEFWVFQSGAREADSAGVRLVIDLGTVSEDALAVAPTDFTVSGSDSTFTGRQYVGPGRLDTERSATGVFNAGVDDIGVLADRPDVVTGPAGPVDRLALCVRELGTTVPVFPWGDLSARCSNGNGALDTEDLNSDNLLDARGGNDNVARWVVDLRAGTHFVRDGVTSVDPNGNVSRWSLYRVPIRLPDHVIGAPNLRLVQQLRVTVAGPPDTGGDDVAARFALARMRFLGTSWARRADQPITGISGSLPEPTGEVAATVISTEDDGYDSPPGVEGSTTRKDGSQDTQGVQINEKSLRLLGSGLATGQRAEAFMRFPAGSQNLLKYGEMRVWLRGRGTGWDEGDFEALIKVGADDDNFYLYRARAATATWVPEVRIDLDVWRRLRGETESRWLSGEAPSGAAECGYGDPEAFVACDGPYLVHVRDPDVSPPNLAAVQEMSAAIWRAAAGTAATGAELWVDDIRMADPISEVGMAYALDARLSASDVGDLAVSLIRQGSQFRQIGRDPTYRTTTNLALGGSTRMERFLPARWGIALPVTASYTRSGVDPELVTGTDLRAADLPGLRQPEAWTAGLSAALRRTARGGGFLTRALVDPVALGANYSTGGAATELSRSHADAYALNLAYRLQLARSGPMLPLGGLLDGLPGWLRETEAAQGMRGSRLTLAPTNVRFTSALTRSESDLSSYGVVVERPSDSLIRPVSSLSHLWRNAVGLTLQPVGMLTLNGDLASTRDLRMYPDSTTIGRLAGDDRQSFLGLDVGTERDRALSTSLTLAPRVTSWLRPRYSTGSNFGLVRYLSGRAPVREDGDTAGAFLLPQTYTNSRGRDLGAALDLERLLGGLLGDSNAVVRRLRGLRPLDASIGGSRSSTYDLATFEPGLGYQLGFGGLDDFLEQDGDQAIGASEIDRSTLTAGADLAYGLSLSLSYSDVESDHYQRVGEEFRVTSISTTEWPIGTVRLTRNFRRGPVAQFVLGATVRERQATTLLPGAGGVTARQATLSENWTRDFQVGLRSGLIFRLGFNTTDQETEANGNLTVLDNNEFIATLNYSFRLPEKVSRSRRIIRASATGRLSDNSTCLDRPTTEACEVITDFYRRDLLVTLDTDLGSLMTGSLQGNWSINDARHLNRRTNQLILTAGFTLSLFAGDFR
ncbi:MAG TPA: cell surface protein SprA [Gemmatimonadales bacterium]|nr:cell surface protein SprA [Gemmatimonadales bacterium]